MFNKNYNICNNCGKNGHIYNNCKNPITSYGIISIRKQKQFEFLMICRKDSLGYVEFLRGKYPLYNKSYIQTLIDEMTVEEKKRILILDFDTLWKKLWNDELGLQYIIEKKNAINKFQQIKRGIQLSESDNYDLNE